MKKPSSILNLPVWYVQVAELMARNSSNVKQASLDLDLHLDPDELVTIERSKDFQDILRSEKNKFYAAVANDPSKTKSTALGMLWVQAEKLEMEGEHDKSAAVVEKLAKVAGWMSEGSNVNVFADLTARDIEEARAKVMKEITPQKPAEA